MSIIRLASVTKKIILAVIGLFLAVFLAVHLAINLCLLRDDSGLWFNAAAHFMRSNYIVNVIEIVLLAAVALHILLAIVIQIDNWKARPVRYKVRSKTKTKTGSKWMIWTGSLMLCFIAIHLINFLAMRWMWVEPIRLPNGDPDRYDIVHQLFGNGYVVIGYVVCLLAVGIHLNHAIFSALQTLGVAHPKYDKAIRILSTGYAVVIAGGFTLIPLWIYCSSLMHF
ncbi:succinate dehydrogenase [Bacteroidia bacterium]|nr:succinate dehydrogenase [Bacteroidia bacterium]